MVKRRKGQPARPSVARHADDKGGTISEMPPAEIAATEPAGAPPELTVTEDHTPSVHDALLETVSPEAIEVAGGHPAPASEAIPADPETASPETASPETAGPEHMAADAASAEEAVPEVAAPEKAATEEAAPAPMEPPAALEAAPVTDPAPVLDAVTTSSVAAMEAVPTPEAVPNRTGDAIRVTSAMSIDVIGEITEANATLLAFLRNEGTAVVAHWQSLSGAKTPADALRIQVDEMQRVADASLTCFAALARRAGRLASGIGRI